MQKLGCGQGETRLLFESLFLFEETGRIDYLKKDKYRMHAELLV